MQPDIKTRPRERDRCRGLPSLGYQLRHLEKRVRQLEAALAHYHRPSALKSVAPDRHLACQRYYAGNLVSPAWRRRLRN
jgi:hypothetical protein